MKCMSWIGILLALAATAHAQSDIPTELEDCVGPGADFCFSGTSALIDSGCGARFEGFVGRIAWPALLNVGPVTIAVQTRNTSFEGQTWFPLYVEVRGRGYPSEGRECNTGLGGDLVLVARGGLSCGGTWESVGPIDLRPYGIFLGTIYSVQCVFFRTVPDGLGARTVGFSCIRVTSTPEALGALTWTAAKRLYK